MIELHVRPGPAVSKGEFVNTHPPFSNVLEQANLPDADTITDALRRLAAY